MALAQQGVTDKENLFNGRKIILKYFFGGEGDGNGQKPKEKEKFKTLKEEDRTRHRIALEQDPEYKQRCSM